MQSQSRSSAERRPYRVAEVSSSLDRGGKERVIAELTRRSDRAKLDVEVVSLADRGPIGSELVAAGYTVHALDCPSGFRPSLIWRLVRLFRESGVDIVHTHDDRAAAHGLPAALMAGVKRRLHTQHHSQIKYGARSKIHLVARVGRLASTFVCVSELGAGLMRGEGIAASALQVVPNGIDLTRFSFSGSNPRGPAVTVARLSPEKDLTTLLGAVAALVEKIPDFRLDIIGRSRSVSRNTSPSSAIAPTSPNSSAGRRCSSSHRRRKDCRFRSLKPWRAACRSLPHALAARPRSSTTEPPDFSLRRATRRLSPRRSFGSGRIAILRRRSPIPLAQKSNGISISIG
jgi:hypothetical protein